MANQNGLLILETLNVIKEPATLTKIATQIANTEGTPLEDIRDMVKATLDGGVQYGFVQKKGQKYYAAALPQEFEKDAEDSEVAEDRNGEGRARRRRRRSTSRSSSRGTRSTRRRSRSRRGSR